MKKLLTILGISAVSAIGNMIISTTPSEARCWYEGPSWARVKVCNYEGTDGTPIEDIQREIDNCINGGGCSLPADEAWGEAGRIAYTSGQQAIAAKNSRLPAKTLTSWQKKHLRPYFGSLVDRVRIKYGATTLDNWRIGIYRISVPSEGQTFCNDIYITQRYRANNRSLLNLIAHEMVHSKQCQDLGGASNFGYKYFKEYKRANQNYENNKLEREAFAFAAKFNSEFSDTSYYYLISARDGFCLYTDDYQSEKNVRVVPCDRGARKGRQWVIDQSNGFIINQREGLCLYTDDYPFEKNVRVVPCDRGARKGRQWVIDQSNGFIRHLQKF